MSTLDGGLGRARGAAVLAGVGAATYGGSLLLARPHRLVEVAAWLGGGVLAHDLVLAPLVLGVVLLGRRLLPAPWQAPAAGGLLVLGSLTLVGIPVLGRFGARADNPTLLDRDYLRGWLLLALAVVLVVAVLGAVRRPNSRERHRGDTPTRVR